VDAWAGVPHAAPVPIEEVTVEWIDEADAVFRGGGVKGIALAGAAAGFGEHPDKPVRRWVNVAGASAGAIIASYLALGHSADDMERLLRTAPFATFQDIPGGKLGAPVNLWRRHGIARGKAFEAWFDDVLGGATFSQVRTEPLPGVDRDWRLKLIAVDVTNHALLVLPDDLAHYRVPGSSQPIDPDTFPISRAARMSMSIPYFFEPVTLEDPNGREAVIIDGGTLSNFPVWLFDVDPAVTGRPPRRPTFGFTLSGGDGSGSRFGALRRLTPWPVRFGVDIFQTAQQAWDRRFASHSTRVRTVAVDGADVSTIDFDLPPDKVELLVSNGRSAARAFLDEFNLDTYLNSFQAAVEP
jgi:NTE family protein